MAMFTVALVGPDGCGKTTIGRRLERALPVPATYIYMGINLDAGTHMLPTTRFLRRFRRKRGAASCASPRRDPAAAATPTDGPARTIGAGIKAWLGLANRVAEECYRQALARYYQARGRIVIFDRHFLCDYYASDIAAPPQVRSLRSRLHAFVLQHVCGKPDLVIYLDAPAEVLFRRKGEGTIESLERRRREYLQLRDAVEHFAVVDACLPEDDVARDAARHITEFMAARSAAAAGGRSACGPRG